MADGIWPMVYGTGLSIDPMPSALSHWPWPASVFTDQLPEHIRQDPAVSERDQLLGRVDARHGLELDLLPAFADRADRDLATRPDPLRDAAQVVALAAGQAKRRGRRARLKLQRQHAHVHEVAAVDALEALGDHGGNAEQQRPFRRPVA